MRVVVRRSIYLLMLLLAASRVAAAQSLLTVSGAVTTGVDGMPVSGAVVSVVGADASTVTDANGRYTTQVPRRLVRRRHLQLQVDAAGLPSKLIDVAVDAAMLTVDVELTLDSEPFAIGIRLRVDPSISSRKIIDGLKAEVEAIWEPYGIRIEWTDATLPEFSTNSVSLDASLVRQFENLKRMQWPTVLGRVTVTPDAPNWHPIRLSFDATRSMLAIRPTSRTSVTGIVLDQELARALGRVLAHEIGHVLLGRYHDQAGLMRAIFRPGELSEADRAPFSLTCGDLSRLRFGIRAF